MLAKTVLLLLLGCAWIVTAAIIRKVKVSQHGDGHYKTIKEAIKSLPNNSETWEIEIDAGVYNEQLIVDRPGPVILRGKTHGKATTYADNLVTIAWNESTATPGASDEDTSALIVNNEGFKAYNINFNQTWGLSFNGSQAVAVTVNSDKVVFDQCLFTGYQDTLFVGNRTSVGRQYFKDCYIAGAVDFIFGNASSYFDHCTIASNGPSHVTAQKRQWIDDSEAILSAMIFNECRIVRDWNTNGVDLTRQCDLGRPWRDHAKVVYMNSFIDDHVKAEGWGSWYSTTHGDYSNVFYAEYNNTGPGSWEENAASRTLNYTRLLNASEAKQFKFEEWFKHDLSWIN
ncbi:hypothetical protein VTP01DRAFT_6305 [Rhizomucor pusillus]|uniref:uncharacterized protein n=1 Tax=Rhizomucor pusillus TaxID=4840 RepID=UPI00374306EB